MSKKKILYVIEHFFNLYSFINNYLSICAGKRK